MQRWNQSYIQGLGLELVPQLFPRCLSGEARHRLVLGMTCAADQWFCSVPLVVLSDLLQRFRSLIEPNLPLLRIHSLVRLCHAAVCPDPPPSPPPQEHPTYHSCHKSMKKLEECKTNGEKLSTDQEISVSVRCQANAAFLSLCLDFRMELLVIKKMSHCNYAEALSYFLRSCRVADHFHVCHRIIWKWWELLMLHHCLASHWKSPTMTCWRMT